MDRDPCPCCGLRLGHQLLPCACGDRFEEWCVHCYFCPIHCDCGWVTRWDRDAFVTTDYLPGRPTPN